MNTSTKTKNTKSTTVSPKIAVLGCGYWGKNLVRNFHELGHLYAVADLHHPAAEKMASQYHVQCLVWDEIIKNPEIDAVVIATPAISHAMYAKQALEAGKHVFVEKPLALKLNDAAMLCQLAKQHNLRLMVGHLLRYHPVFQKLQSIIKQGNLGRIQYVYSNRLNFGKIRREEDILWSFAPHDISMIISLIGSEPESVDAIGGYYLHKTIADVTTTHLVFPGGEQAHIFVSWLHPFKEQKLIVVGDRGMAVFDDGQSWKTKLTLYPHQVEWLEGMPLPAKADAVFVGVEEAEPLQEECKHFVRCIMNHESPITDGEEGLRVLKILDKATKSLTEKQKPSASMLHLHSKHEKAEHQLRFPGVEVHESAYVDEDVEIGEGTKIWHFSHILSKTTLGKQVSVGQNVMIGPEVVVGNHCKIQNNVSLYKGVTLEEGVFCGPSCVFTNVNNPRAEISRKNEFRPTYVERGVTIGANATIVCGHRLGAYSFIAAGAVVTNDVPPYALMAGVPARQIGWMSEAGERLGKDLVCPRTGTQYHLNHHNQLERMNIELDVSESVNQ